MEGIRVYARPWTSYLSSRDREFEAPILQRRVTRNPEARLRRPEIASIDFPLRDRCRQAAGVLSPPIRRNPRGRELGVARAITHDGASRVTFLADAAGYADRFRLTAEQSAS